MILDLSSNISFIYIYIVYIYIYAYGDHDVKGKDSSVSRTVATEEEKITVKSMEEVKMWWAEGRWFCSRTKQQLYIAA